MTTTRELIWSLVVSAVAVQGALRALSPFLVVLGMWLALRRKQAHRLRFVAVRALATGVFARRD